MKRLLIITSLILLSLTIKAQNKPAESAEYKKTKQIFYKALRYNDTDAAKMAIYQLMAIDPSNTSLYDSLAFIYYDNQIYTSCVLVCNDILNFNPRNLEILQMRAISLDALGAKDKALEDFESLYLKSSNNLSLLYKITTIQYETKRYNECKTNIDIIIKDPKSDSLKLQFPLPQNGEQQIPLKAVAYNLKGVVNLEQGLNAEAKKEFEMALKIKPDFYQAKENIKKAETKPASK